MLPPYRLISSSDKNVHRYILIGGLTGKRPDPGNFPHFCKQCLYVDSAQGVLLGNDIHSQVIFGRLVKYVAKRVVLTDAKDSAINVFC